MAGMSMVEELGKLRKEVKTLKAAKDSAPRSASSTASPEVKIPTGAVRMTDDDGKFIGVSTETGIYAQWKAIKNPEEKMQFYLENQVAINRLFKPEFGSTFTGYPRHN